MANNIKARVAHKHDTEANWRLATNFTPLDGEIIIYDADATHDQARVKVGDGATNVNNLPFIGAAVEKDWKENDPSSPSYIKNRTHYIHLEPDSKILVFASDNLTFQEDVDYWYTEVEFDSSSVDYDEGTPFLIELDNSEEFFGYYNTSARVRQIYAAYPGHYGDFNFATPNSTTAYITISKRTDTSCSPPRSVRIYKLRNKYIETIPSIFIPDASPDECGGVMYDGVSIVRNDDWQLEVGAVSTDIFTQGTNTLIFDAGLRRPTGVV